jgi:DUF2950 family protein
MTLRIALGVSTLLALAGRPALAQSGDPAKFKSPEDASRTLVAAIQNDDTLAVTNILGGGEALLQDDDSGGIGERHEFAQKYQQMHRLVRENDGTTLLYVGAENWPFPVPLVSSHGQWHFDGKTGTEEVLYRRIGENEMMAVDECHELATGADSAGEPAASHGYNYRPLPGTPGAFVAYPVAYKSSGVMTFIIGHDNVVYEKDNGTNTERLAQAMTTYHRDGTWRRAE